MNQWKNRIAVITGAGSGIGRGLARQCALRGMHVIASDVDASGLSQLEQELTQKKQSIETFNLDVRDSEAVENFAVEVFSKHSQVNLLFNNAGVLVDGKSWERSIKDWQWNFDVNVMGVVNGIRSFVPKMLAQNAEGKIINTASIGGLLGGGSFLAPYQGTKHAVVAITESLHAELSLEQAPITAACLCPGDTATGIWESDRLLPESEHHKFGSDVEQQMHDVVAGMCAVGFTADKAAEKTLEGIEAGKFWIFPQPEFKALFQLRVDAILNEDSPPSAEEFMATMMT